jgi:hypothetical protein
MSRKCSPGTGHRRVKPTPKESQAAAKHVSGSATGGAGVTCPDGNPSSEEPQPGLDRARHTAAQRAAHQAEVLKDGAFPAFMASALGLDRHIEATAYRVYLGRVLKDLGDPADPIERMLVEQLCMAHFRTAQLHVGAGQAQGAEAVKLYNAIAARMLGEMRRTALALKAYRTGVPAGQPRGATLKLFKAAR